MTAVSLETTKDKIGALLIDRKYGEARQFMEQHSFNVYDHIDLRSLYDTIIYAEHELSYCQKHRSLGFSRADNNNLKIAYPPSIWDGSKLYYGFRLADQEVMKYAARVYDANFKEIRATEGQTKATYQLIKDMTQVNLDKIEANFKNRRYRAKQHNERKERKIEDPEDSTKMRIDEAIKAIKRG